MDMIDAFARHKAMMRSNYDVSAISLNRELVISCNDKHFKTTRTTATYISYLSDFHEKNRGARNQLEEHLRMALAQSMPVRAVICREVPPDAEIPCNENGHIFYPKPWIGTLISFDGDKFIIEFVNEAQRHE